MSERVGVSPSWMAPEFDNATHTNGAAIVAFALLLLSLSLSRRS